MKDNPFVARLGLFFDDLRRQRIDGAAVFSEANIKALTGIECDNACLFVMPARPGGEEKDEVEFFTDFRYVPMVHRLAPWLKVRDIKAFSGKTPLTIGRRTFRRVGFESSIPHAKYALLAKVFPGFDLPHSAKVYMAENPQSHLAPGAEFIDVLPGINKLRAVKTKDELDCVRAAAALNDVVWTEARNRFRPGMTEREMARIIKHLMIDKGDGEAFSTIVSVGKNAAECHHMPDDTVWNGCEPVLVDMGVKLDGYCSDMTRNIVPDRQSSLYRKIYSLVLEANRRAIAAVRPGMKASDLDGVARRYLAKAGFGKKFGHSLGHGVGIEIHEAPVVGKRSQYVLEKGMVVTIEPGLYLEGVLGVRIEDLVIVGDKGAEVISNSAK